MSLPSPACLTEFRAATRHLIRELGLMNKTFPDTGLGLTEVHAVVEIAAHPGMTAKALSATLLLEKSTVSRLLKGLSRKGLLAETRSDQDGRAKHLTLTDAGQKTLSHIDQFAEEIIRPALSRLTSDQCHQILGAVELYGRTLSDARQGLPLTHPTPQIQVGYIPGLASQIGALHGTYYTDEFDFKPTFELRVARDMGELACRLDHPDNNMWSVWEGESLLGAVAVDGETMSKQEGRPIGQVRCFIVSPGAQGRGIGRLLLRALIEDCDKRDVPELLLYTLRELPAALHLYAEAGFELVSEQLDDEFGPTLHLQCLRRLKP